MHKSEKGVICLLPLVRNSLVAPSRNDIINLENHLDHLIRQLNLLPAHLREISLKDANARAERDLAVALEKNDVAELLKMVRRYQGTPASQNALRLAALRCWDRGDFADAAHAHRRCAGFPFCRRAGFTPDQRRFPAAG